MQALPSIALVVIARNESRCIKRCLLSARDYVDRMLVLDTGSTDDTIAIALSCGAEVHSADWTGDFSAARNRALLLADADWNLVMDADEWLQDGGISPASCALCGCASGRGFYGDEGAAVMKAGDAITADAVRSVRPVCALANKRMESAGKRAQAKVYHDLPLVQDLLA